MSIYLNNIKFSGIGPTGPQGYSGDYNKLKLNTNSQTIELGEEKYEYYNITNDTTINLPDESIIDNNKYIEYHLFLKFSNNYTINFNKSIDKNNLPEINSGDTIECVIKLLKFETSYKWLCQFINSN